MKVLGVKNIETKRLLLKKPTMEEQHRLWEILILSKVNSLYMPTPSRFNGDREAFLKELSDWDKQKKYYKMKIDLLDDNSNMFTWSIFLKTGEVIGQMTVQPCKSYPENPEIRDVGWFIDPKYQGNGYAFEAASAVLEYMFKEVGIERIITSAAQINSGSWKLMEKLGMERVGEKESPYLDKDGNYLKSYVYILDKEKFYNKSL